MDVLLPEDSVAKKKYLVTDALPYANGKLHLGHIAGSHLPGDIYVRYQRLKGHDVLHIGGTDDHGVPITLTADKAGITPKEVVDTYYPIIFNSLKSLGITFDNFSQTSRPIHHETSRDFFTRLHENDRFDLREVDQIYCPSTNRSLPDRYVEGICPHCKYEGARGDQCENCGTMLDGIQLINPVSDLCDVPLEVRRSSHWYFKLSEAQESLEHWLKGKTDWKDSVLNYCAGWFALGLEDRPITRDLDWGIALPLDNSEGKVMYVWFEAVIGYVSSTREWAERIGDPERWKTYWHNPDCTLVHFMGKDNIVFHAVLWPAMLMAHGDYILPTSVPANEFLNIEGQKLSTSRNWAIWLDEYLEDFSPDPLRYYLAAIAPETKDADFSWKDFQARNNNELADIFGNFVNRSLTFITRYFDGAVPSPGEFASEDEALLKLLKETPKTVGDCFENFQVRAAVRELILLGNHFNKYFNDQAPWHTRKTDRDRCGTTLYVCAQAVRTLAVIIAPVLPFTADKIWEMLQLEGTVSNQRWDEAGEPGVPAGHKIGQPEILFSKFEDERIEAQIAKLGKPQTPAQLPLSVKTTDLNDPEKNPTIPIDVFQKIELRVADILSAERVPKTDKLLKLRIRIGTEERQIVSGIAPTYDPADLPGRQIVVVANLQPATIRGVESKGMLLAATNTDGDPVLLIPDTATESGAEVK